MIVYMGRHHGFLFYFGALTVLFATVIGLEIYIFNTRIIKELLQVDKIQKLLKAQELSARLLIRRDRELTKANEQLQDLDRRKSEFLSVVAHQLRTPLSGIKWTLNMMLGGELGPLTDEQKNFLHKSYESNQRMIGLIEDMLGADRIGSGKLQYSFSLVNIMDVLEDVLYEFIPAAKKKDIKITLVEPKEELPKVFIDEDKICDVFQNLLENSIKYTPEKGTVEVSLERVNDIVKVGIKDNGIGIPQEQQKNLFTRFFRATNAVKMQTDGSGLGLFIIKGIVEKHGGSIWFESEEGKGTTFYFTLKIG